MQGLRGGVALIIALAVAIVGLRFGHRIAAVERPAIAETPPAVAPAPPPVVKDDKPTRAESYETWWKLYSQEKRGFPFKDLSHWVDIEQAEDTRWTANWTGMARRAGHQVAATWSRARSEHPWDIRVDVFKSIHEEQSGGRTITYSTPFDHIGKSIPTADVGKIADAYYEDWIKSASDVIDDECKAPRKKRFGKIRALYAYATGTDKTTNARERREWYIWSTANVTWIARARYQANLLKKDDLLKKGTDFMKLVREIR